MSTNNIFTAAMAYTMRGFSVIPLKNKEKRPSIASWDPYKDRIATNEEIDYWFQLPRNVGIVTGAVSGIVVLDIDGPEGEEALRAMLSRFGDLPPTWCSTTGKGKHYLFRHPGQEIRNSAHRKLCIDIRGDGGYIVAPPSVHPSGATYTWIQPAEQDIADLPQWLLDWMTSERQPEWVHDLLVELGRENRKEEKQKNTFLEKQENRKEEKYSASSELMFDHCAFCRHCKDNAGTLSEPEWYAMLSNVGRVPGGSELVHELSKPHPSYDKRSTDAKLKHALDNDPHTCEYIQTRTGFTGCPSNGCGVKAPVVFATSEIYAAQATIRELLDSLMLEKRPSPSIVFDEKYIKALGVVRRRDLGAYSVAKNQIKQYCKDINLRDLEQVIKSSIEAQDRAVLEEKSAEACVASKEVLKQYDLGYQVIQPDGWRIDATGVYPVTTDPESKPILPVPLFLTKRIINADSGEEKVEITFARDEELKQMIVQRPVAFNKSQIVSLAAHALPVTSENAKDIINYLHDFESANMATLPLSRSVNRLGWIGTSQFVPFCADVSLDIDPGMSGIASGYTTSGDLETWLAVMREARQSSIVRMMMAASFAAPMLKLAGHRVFLLHVWGPSRGGKTASLKAALSIWGEPETIMASFNSTRVGLERLAGFYSDLPLGIDERQIVGNKQDLIESLVYLIGMGKGKTRGTKGGGIQAAQTWRTIALTTGEEPLSSDSSNTGIKTRTIEIYGMPFHEEKLASRVHQVTKDNYGYAGQKFIESLIQFVQEKPNDIKQIHELIMARLAKKFEHHMGATISQLAILALGDFWSSVDIFGMSREQAYDEALSMVEMFAVQIQTSQEADEAMVAAQKFQSWINANIFNFDEKVSNRAGFQKNGAWNVFSHKFDQVMKELNFNPSRMLRDWAKHGIIKIKKEGDRTRYRIREWDNAFNNMTEVIAFIGFKDEI